MKISDVECARAYGFACRPEARILPEGRMRGELADRELRQKDLSRLEKSMAVAEAALVEIPDTREDLVQELKAKIERGEYGVSGEKIADMMLRRLSADRIR